ncbi:hypothetical protein PSE10B_46660 [Pseudomonas amygdali pv. eriobotryae]|nr:hypothetical protein PSE10A_53090 [Pseudomonas amygdali pv. eriobotryae]GFZ68144.1 hypothetical protein PSE10B_46660 [Pseudomonas amygdali pv. eriobotryae]GFZ73866.1 hypothetical protein PSE10C_46080 [Pseudomonas amygdali pv. eriobotryae]
MQAGSLYYHFPSKVDVLEEVLDSLLQQRLNDWLSIKIRGDDVITQLDAFVSFHVNRVLRYTKEEDLLMLELKNLNGAQRATIFAQDELYTGELISIIKQGVRSGIFRVTDAAVAARALLGLLSGGATRSDGLDGSVKITLTQMSHRVLGM